MQRAARSALGFVFIYFAVHILIESCIDPKRLQVWIGHENIKLTLDTYGHLLADQERDAGLALEASKDLFA